MLFQISDGRFQLQAKFLIILRMITPKPKRQRQLTLIIDSSPPLSPSFVDAATFVTAKCRAFIPRAPKNASLHSVQIGEYREHHISLVHWIVWDFFEYLNCFVNL